MSHPHFCHMCKISFKKVSHPMWHNPIPSASLMHRPPLFLQFDPQIVVARYLHVLRYTMQAAMLLVCVQLALYVQVAKRKTKTRHVFSLSLNVSPPLLPHVQKCNSKKPKKARADKNKSLA